jgi:hypothetical protein
MVQWLPLAISAAINLVLANFSTLGLEFLPLRISDAFSVSRKKGIPDSTAFCKHAGHAVLTFRLFDFVALFGSEPAGNRCRTV